MEPNQRGYRNKCWGLTIQAEDQNGGSFYRTSISLFQETLIEAVVELNMEAWFILTVRMDLCNLTVSTSPASLYEVQIIFLSTCCWQVLCCFKGIPQ